MAFFGEYETHKVVKIPSYLLKWTFICWLIGSTVYVFGYAVVWERGYQLVCPVQSMVMSRLDGAVNMEFTDEEINVPNPTAYRRGVWDHTDLTVSPSSGLENGGFFVLTNFVMLPNQTRGRCPSAGPVITGQGRPGTRPRKLHGSNEQNQNDTDPFEQFVNSTCVTDKDCKAPGFILSGGITTGRCVPEEDVARQYRNDGGPSMRTCEIGGWCPVGPIVLPFGGSRPILEGAASILAIIENAAEFPACGPEYRRKNYHNYTNIVYRKYLSSCIYNESDSIDRYCPRFRVGDMVRLAGANFTHVAISGAVFTIRITWNCSFDWGYTIQDCLPEYRFLRSDDTATSVLGLGTTFQSVTYHDDDRRTLRRNFGLRFYIEVDGNGRRFDFLTFSLVVGSGLGIIGMGLVFYFYSKAAAIADAILIFLIKLKNMAKWKWLHYYDEEMKYDLSYTQNDKDKIGSGSSRSRRSDNSMDLYQY